MSACTKHSASPLEDGWYGVLRMCFTLLAFMKSQKLDDVNCGLLSDTSCPGNPYEANN